MNNAKHFQHCLRYEVSSVPGSSVSLHHSIMELKKVNFFNEITLGIMSSAAEGINQGIFPNE
jgi:hypothetical protein